MFDMEINMLRCPIVGALSSKLDELGGWSAVCKVKSLSTICCNVIVYDAKFTHACLNKLPSRLMGCLLSCAIEQSKDRVIEVLLAHWPLASISIGDYMQPIEIKQYLQPRSNFSERIILLTKIAYRFIKLAAKDKLMKLRYLDLSSSDVYLRNLDPLLVVNTLPGNSADAASSIKESKSKSDNDFYGKFTLRLSYEISSASSVRILNHIVNNDDYSFVKIEIDQLSAYNVGESVINDLLSLPCFTTISSAYLHLNSLGRNGCVNVINHLNSSQKESLVHLNLASNLINYSQYERTSFADVNKAIASISGIQSLSLKSNNIGNHLSQILCNITNLQNVALSSCILKQQDLRYLLTSPLLKSLKYLDLSENCLFDDERFPLLKKILVATKNSLEGLEIESVGFNSENCREIASSLHIMNKLRYFNIAYNDGHGDYISEMLNAPALRALKISNVNEADVEELITLVNEKRCQKNLPAVTFIICDTYDVYPIYE